MANLNVTYADMQNAANQLISGRADVDAKLTELKAYVDNLVSGGYITDQSSGAFQEQVTQFTTQTRLAVEALDGMAHFLQQAASTMESTDAQLAAAIRR